MKTTSFATFARRFSVNQLRISRKGGKTMRILKELMALTVAVGITTAAYADGGWITIYPDQIKGVGARNGDYSELKTTKALEALAGGGAFTTKECQGWGSFFFEVNNPMHDRFFTLLTTAMVTGQNIEARIECNAVNNYLPLATSVNIYVPNR